MRFDLPYLGSGLSYRQPLHRAIMANRSSIDFLEVITDQFIYTAPEKYSNFIDTIASQFPVAPHSINMSVGTDMPMDLDYISRTAQFIKDVGAPWFSDHLCFTKVPDVDIGQLTPLCFTEETLKVISRNLSIMREHIKVPILLENITYYFQVPNGEMTEAEFITAVLEENDCGLLLDINNVYLNSVNHGFDPYQFLRSIPLERVVQVHIAGFHAEGELLIDTHAGHASPEVWDLLRFVAKSISIRGASVEWDDQYPPFSEIVDEMRIGREILQEAERVRVGSAGQNERLVTSHVSA